MKNLMLCGIITICTIMSISAQIATPKFGSGVKLMGKDSSYYMKIGVRFQTLYAHNWDHIGGSFENYDASILVRRSRLKFDGWAHSPKLKYKLELALSNRDNSGGASSEFSNAANIILDASVAWNFYKNLSIQFGQRKLPGNRERVISSGNLQFVDRSRLNSRYNIDRDVGIQLLNHHTIGEKFLVREVFALSQGEGRNVTRGFHGAYDYTFRVEMLPFGAFAKKGDYVGSDVYREKSPKLSVGVTYDINSKAVRERGQLGSFIIDEFGRKQGKQLNTLFVDLMFKYNGWSIMSEYVDKKSEGSHNVIGDNEQFLGTYYTGTGFNVQLGYLMPSNWELAGRYTIVTPESTSYLEEKHYTLGLNKFVVGHKLKVQNDLSYIQYPSADGNEVMFRTQVDIHF